MSKGTSWGPRPMGAPGSHTRRLRYRRIASVPIRLFRPFVPMVQDAIDRAERNPKSAAVPAAERWLAIPIRIACATSVEPGRLVGGRQGSRNRAVALSRQRSHSPGTPCGSRSKSPPGRRADGPSHQPRRFTPRSSHDAANPGICRTITVPSGRLARSGRPTSGPGAVRPPAGN